ncbi:AI-2E family transporter [Actinocorallia lasiicapitis]
MRARISDGLLLLIGGAGAVICLAGIKAVSSLAGPFFLALVLTVAVSPLRNRLIARGAKGWVTATVPLLVVLLVLALFAVSLGYSVARLATVLPQYQQQFTDLTHQVTSYFSAHGIGRKEVTAAMSGFSPGKLVPYVEGFLNGLLGAMSAIVLIVLLLYSMSLDAVGMNRALRRLDSSRPQLVAALRGYSQSTAKYLLVSTVFGLIVAVADVGALALLGVPLPILWGLLSFITNYIPNVGFILGLIPPALLALLDSGVGTAVWVIVVYSVLNFVIQSLIQPKFVGDSAGLSVTVTLVSLAVWTIVLGPLGSILAVPLTLLVRALLIDTDPDKDWLRPLLSAD